MDRIEADTMPEALRNLDKALNDAVEALHSISREIDHVKNKGKKEINAGVLERILPKVFNPFRDGVFAMNDIEMLSKKRQEEFDYSEERLTRSFQASQSLRDQLSEMTAQRDRALESVERLREALAGLVHGKRTGLFECHCEAKFEEELQMKVDIAHEAWIAAEQALAATEPKP